MTLVETFERPSKGKNRGDRAAYEARMDQRDQSIAAEVAKAKAALGPVRLEEFKDRDAKVVPAGSGFGFDITVSFGKDSSADVRVAKELSSEQVTAVRSAGSLAPTKPKGFGDGPA